jgi:flagellar biogenesis protein FliO
MISRLVLGTVLVLVLCGGTLWIGKRWLGTIQGKKLPAGHLGVLETLALGRRGSLVLVKVGAQQILVGLDHAGIKGMVALPMPFEGALEDFQMAGSLNAGPENEPASVAAAGVLEERSHG